MHAALFGFVLGFKIGLWFGIDMAVQARRSVAATCFAHQL